MTVFRVHRNIKDLLGGSLIALSVTIILRILGIGNRPIWYDEAFSILYSRSGPQQIYAGTMTLVSGTASDIHPLGYYLLLWIWTTFLGSTIVSARILSILFGIGSIILAYLIVIQLLTRKVAKMTFLLLAISPFQIHYAQEIRMYSMLAFFCLLATWSLIKAQRSNRNLYWFLFSLSITLSQYVHHLAFLYLIPLTFTMWIFYRLSLKNLCLSIGIAVLLYAPWGINLIHQFEMVKSSYWTEKPGVDRLITLLLSYVTNLPLPSNFSLTVGLISSFSILSVFGWLTIRKFVVNQVPLEAILIIILAFTPPILMYIVSLFVPIYIERAMLAAGIFFWIWVSWCLVEGGLPLVIRYMIMGVIVVSSVVGIYYHVTYMGFPYASYSEISQWLVKSREENSLIVHSNKLSFLPMKVYQPNLDEVFFDDPPNSGSQTLKTPTQQVLGIESIPFFDTSRLAGFKSVYLIIFRQAIDEFLRAGYSKHPHMQALEELYPRQTRIVWDDLVIIRYYR